MLGSLDKFGFKDIAKFTIGFFIDPKNEVIIPSEIPDTINGKHLVNWKFLLKNCNNFGDYTKKRISGEIIDEDGLLKLK